MEVWLQFLVLSCGLCQQLSIQDRDNDETNEDGELARLLRLLEDLHRGR